MNLIYLAPSPHETRATNVPVTVTSGSRETKLTVDQTRPLPAGQHFQSIGTAELVADVETTIQIRNADTTGIVVLDAVRLEAVE